mmetsp:Transcript_4961/g.6813  ORF Transcript_4961/g.6813 Transcript_4961/m.6813 type:complete len:291 (+) Transcript_4961:2525-3397(+)
MVWSLFIGCAIAIQQLSSTLGQPLKFSSSKLRHRVARECNPLALIFAHSLISKLFKERQAFASTIISLFLTLLHPAILSCSKAVQYLARVFTAFPVMSLHPVSFKISRSGHPFAITLRPSSRTCLQPSISRRRKPVQFFPSSTKETSPNSPMRVHSDTFSSVKFVQQRAISTRPASETPVHARRRRVSSCQHPEANVRIDISSTLHPDKSSFFRVEQRRAMARRPTLVMRVHPDRPRPLMFGQCRATAHRPTSPISVAFVRVSSSRFGCNLHTSWTVASVIGFPVSRACS